jgi:glycosyltransferase involved in cell wall biosynthesis
MNQLNNPISIYLCHLGIRENLTQSQVVPYLEGLFDVFQQPIILLTHEKSALNGKARAKIRDSMFEKGIIWESVPYHNFDDNFTKGLFCLAKIRDLVFSFRKVREILWQYPYLKIIHIRSYFHTPIALYFLYLSCRFSIKFLWDIRGFYLDEYVEMNLGKKDIFYYLLKRFEKFVFGKCDALVVLTNQTINTLTEMNYSFPDNYAVIPTSISSENFSTEHYFSNSDSITNNLNDLDSFDNLNNLNSSKTVLIEKLLSDKKLSKQHLSELLQPESLQPDLSERLILVYAGSLGEMYCENEMTTFFHRLVKKFEDLQINNKPFFLILTKSSNDNLQRNLETFGFQNNQDFNFLSVQPDQMKDYLLAADFGLNFAKNCFANQARCSTKFAEYLACGMIPVSNQGIGDIDDYSQQFSNALLIERNRFAKQNFENEIEQIIQIEFDNNLKANSLSQGINLAHTEFSMKKAVEKYAEIYRSLL